MRSQGVITHKLEEILEATRKREEVMSGISQGPGGQMEKEGKGGQKTKYLNRERKKTLWGKKKWPRTDHRSPDGGSEKAIVHEEWGHTGVA